MVRVRNFLALAVALALLGATWAWAAPDPFTRFTVYYVFSAPTEFYLVPVGVVVPATSTPARRALELLIQGPPPGSFLHGPVPANTRILDLNISDGLATVNFSQEITGVGGSRSEALLLAAIANTLAQFETVDRIQILVDGQKTSVGGHIDASDPIQPAYQGVIMRQQFTDISGHWAEGNINAFFLTGLVAGYGDGTFRPNQDATRAEFVKLLVLAAGHQETRPAQASFADVPPQHWAYGYVQSAVASGILVPSDYGANFGPNAKLTRREMAMLMTRARNLEQRATELRDAPLAYTDASDIPAWARGYIGVVTELGLMQGYPDGRFRPGGTALRSEVTSVLTRYLGMGETNVRLVAPKPNTQVGDWVLLGGVARAFEANVESRILHPDGSEYLRTFTTATEGGPGWGFWAIMFPTPSVTGAQDITVEAFTTSAEDGSVQDLVKRTIRRTP